MSILIGRKRIFQLAIAVLFASAVLIYVFAYINAAPGGLSDRRMSHATGLKGTIKIPLGKTPEDAIQQN